MANLPEINEFTAGVYQIETSDPVLGGVDGITNVPLKALVNRSRWLKNQVDALAADVAAAVDAAYVQDEINKLPFKAPVVAVTTTNITLSGLQTIDGVSLTAGQRVLVAAQSAAAQNGIYTAQTSAWVRADDMNADVEIQAGVQVVVTDGAIFADTIWHLLTDGTITIGTTPQTWKCLTNNTALLGDPTAPTQAQFNSSTRLATTEFVQRALGNMFSTNAINGATTLLAANAGMLHKCFGSSPYTVTLPLANSVPSGAAFSFFCTNSTGVTISRAGTNSIQASSAQLTSITLGDGDTLRLVSDGSGAWFPEGGSSAQLGRAGAFGSSLTASGYQKLPSGLIIQWGTTSLPAVGSFNQQTIAGVTYYTNYYTITYPIAFTTSSYSSIVSIASSEFGNQVGMAGHSVSSNLMGNGSPLTRHDVAVTTTTLGYVPIVHWVVIGR